MGRSFFMEPKLRQALVVLHVVQIKKWVLLVRKI